MIRIALFALWLTAAGLGQVSAQTFQSLGSASLAVTVASARVALPAGTSGGNITVLNVGTDEAFINFGGSTVTATTANESVPSGSGRCFAITSQTFVAAITAANTATLRISQGSGPCALSYRGGSSTGVTAAAVLTDNQLVVGDGGARGIKTANATITGTYTFAGPTTFGVITNATSAAIGGATIGSNALAWTGTAAGSGLLALADVLAFSGNTATTPTRGIGSLGTSDLSVYVSGARNFAFSGTALYLLGSSPQIILNSNTAPAILFGASSDVIVTRGGAAGSLQFGMPDAAVAVAQTTRVQSVVAGTAAANGANWTLIGSLPTGTGTSGDIIFQTGVKTGSGTTQGIPTTALTIKGETQNIFLGNTAGSSAISLGGATSGVSSLFVSNRTALWSGGILGWSSTSDPSVAIDAGFSRVSAGLVQLGTTTANALGSLNLTNLTGTGTIIIGTGDAASSTGGALQVTGGASIAKRFWIPAITASAGLQTAVLCQSSGGEMIADSVACLASSERAKEDIKPSDMGLNVIMALKPVTYRYRLTGNNRFDNAPNQRAIHAGFSAEQAAAVDKRLVAYDADGSVRTIRPDAIPAALVLAFQEMQAELAVYRKVLH